MPNVKAITSAARVASRRPFRVSIEGNIGSGKSTCIKYFEKFPNVEAHAVSILFYLSIVSIAPELPSSL